MVALNTPGDGNCLLHGAAFAMWGLPDTEELLRAAVSSDCPAVLIKQATRARKLANACAIVGESVSGGYLDVLSCCVGMPCMRLRMLRAMQQTAVALTASAIHSRTVRVIAARAAMPMPCSTPRSPAAIALRRAPHGYVPAHA